MGKKYLSILGILAVFVLSAEEETIEEIISIASKAPEEKKNVCSLKNSLQPSAGITVTLVLLIRPPVNKNPPRFIGEFQKLIRTHQHLSDSEN